MNAAPLTIADLITHLLTLDGSAPVVKFDGMGGNEPIASFPTLNEYGEFDVNASETFYKSHTFVAPPSVRIVCRNTCLE